MIQDNEFNQYFDAAALKQIFSYIENTESDYKFLFDMIDQAADESFSMMKKTLFSGFTKSKTGENDEKNLKDIIKINKIKDTRELNKILLTDSTIDQNLMKLLIKHDLVEYDELLKYKKESEATLTSLWKNLNNAGKVSRYTLLDLLNKEYRIDETEEQLKSAMCQFLLKEKFVSLDKLRELYKESYKENKNIIQTLIDMDIINSENLAKKLESAIRIKYIQPSNDTIAPEILKNIQQTLIQEFLVLPLIVEKGYLFVGMVNPFDVEILKQISRSANLQLKPVIIDYQYFVRASSKIFKSTRQQSLSADAKTSGDIAHLPVIEIVQYIIDTGVRTHATDIHIEPLESVIRVRYRIDGMLNDLLNLPLSLAPAIISRIKVLADMDITKVYASQDGHITTKANDRIIDLRVGTVYTLHGEKLVLRIIDPDRVMLNVEQLGLEQKENELLDELLLKSQGVLLVTGPVGSGKTTMLYACLNKLNIITRNIMTIEDPIEYKLANINQIQVNIQRDQTFYNGLRAILRQDPDIIMVGEIRDTLTADVAIRAAMTGTLVLSTIHANSSINTISTLRHMGIANYLMANSIAGILAQRLVRKICPHCSKKKTIDLNVARRLKYDAAMEHFYGSGCRFCYNSGYIGRTAVTEILDIDNVISEYIINNESEQKILEYAKKKGFNTLSDISLAKVKAGITTPEEIFRVVNV